MGGAMQTSRNTCAVFLLGVFSGLVLPVVGRALHTEVEAQEGKMPFASAIDQRQQTVEEMRKLNALMQKQLDLLTSGRVRVVVVDERAESGRR
jgi:hypothetical protein